MQLVTPPRVRLACVLALVCACSESPPDASAPIGTSGAGAPAATGAGGAGAASVAGAAGAPQSNAGRGAVPIGGASAGTAAKAGQGGMPAAGSGGQAGDAAGAPAAGEGAAGAAGAAGNVAPTPDVGDPKVDLPGGITALFPGPNGTELCRDPSLRLTFSGTPRLGSGRIQVIDAASGAAAATVDVSATSSSDMIGGESFNLTPPVEVDEQRVVIRLPSRGLEYGKRYRVTIDRGAITGPSGAVEIGASTWEFETRKAGPTDLSKLTVAANGSGDFCTPQAAIDAVPASSTARRTIQIAPGTYRGLINFARKTNLTIRGEDRKKVVLQGVNNDKLNPGTAKRALVGCDECQDLIVENLTIHNLTPQGGSQAEALRLQRCERCSVRDADILSLQDTLLWSGKVYARNSYIAGNVDFIWGTGAAFFEDCEIKTVGRSGYIVQSRNMPGQSGFVFVNSRLTSDAGVNGVVLARIDASAYPGSHVAYIDCEMGGHIAPAGWTVTGGAGSSLRFVEYGSKSPGGTPIDTSRRHASSRQLSESEAAAMRDPANVLGGWKPPQ